MTREGILNILDRDVEMLRRKCSAIGVAVSAERGADLEDAMARTALHIRELLDQLELPEPEPGGEEDIDLVAECQRLGGRITEHYYQLTELKQKHDLRLKHLGGTVGSHEEALGAARKELADLTGRVDSVCAGDSTHWCDMQSQIRILSERLDALTPAPKSACEHPEDKVIKKSYWARRLYIVLSTCSCGAVRLGLDKFVDGVAVHGCDVWYVPQPPCEPPKAACEHPVNAINTIGRDYADEEDILWCTECGAHRSGNGRWMPPKPKSETPDGE